MFDWDRFKNGEIAVHCDTEEKANDFLKECDENNIKWNGYKRATEGSNCWRVREENTAYGCIRFRSLGYADCEFYRNKGMEIIKWEVKEMKKLTFKEVIANIKEGEVWENEIAPISFIRLRADGVLDFNENQGINLNCTYKLKRKEYTFEEAFKAYEEGKEIESESYKYKKCNGADCFKLITSIKDEWIKCEDGFKIHLDEIRGKWYIND